MASSTTITILIRKYGIWALGIFALAHLVFAIYIIDWYHLSTFLTALLSVSGLTSWIFFCGLLVSIISDKLFKPRDEDWNKRLAKFDAAFYENYWTEERKAFTIKLQHLKPQQYLELQQLLLAYRIGQEDIKALPGSSHPQEDISAFHEFYIDYVSLTIQDFTELLTSYNRLFKLFFLAAHPEISSEQFEEMRYGDMLEIYTAHTGFSIVFRTAVNGRFSFKLTKGGYEISIPKGYAPYYVLGSILAGAITLGMYNYNTLLDIELKKQTIILQDRQIQDEMIDELDKELAREKMRLEIQILRQQLNEQNLEQQEQIQKELDTLKHVTQNNPMINKITFNDHPTKFSFKAE